MPHILRLTTFIKLAIDVLSNEDLGIGTQPTREPEVKKSVCGTERLGSRSASPREVHADFFTLGGEP